MAGPTVKLTFAGDSSSLDKAFSNVGTSSGRMADDVGTASDRMRGAGGGLDDLTGKVDKSEQRFIGVSDAITGTGDVMRGVKEGDMQLMAMGFADLASSMVNLVLPAISGIATKALPALRTAMTFISSHPLLIVLGLLVIAFGILWASSETFRDKVKAVFNAVKDWIVKTFGAAVDWVKDKFTGLVDWFQALPGRIGGFFRAIGDGIKAAFRGAFNAVAGIWNSTVGRLSFTIPSWVPFGLGGKNFSVPKMPTFHTGGVMGGQQGAEGLALLQAGERVIPRGQAQGGGAIELRIAPGADSALAALLMSMVRTGQLQLVAA